MYINDGRPREQRKTTSNCNSLLFEHGKQQPPGLVDQAIDFRIIIISGCRYITVGERESHLVELVLSVGTTDNRVPVIIKPSSKPSRPLGSQNVTCNRNFNDRTSLRSLLRIGLVHQVTERRT
jgi:hypothetical protein